MQAPREIKRWIAKARRARGKKNGVVRWLWDHPEMERKMANDKRGVESDSTCAPAGPRFDRP